MIHSHEGSLSIIVRGDRAEIEITDEKSGLYALTLEFASVDLIAAIARHGNVKCRFWLNENGTVGSTREVKTEMVPFDFTKHKHPADEYRTPAAIKALAPFEVDGWEANERDLWNGHCRELHEGDKPKQRTPFQRVAFTRFLRDGVPIVLERAK